MTTGPTIPGRSPWAAYVAPGIRRSGLVALGALAISGCGSSPIPFVPPGPDCEKVAVHISLRLDPTHLWGIDYAHDDRIVAVLPRTSTGWTIDPGPPPRLVDAVGREVSQGGAIFYQACVDSVTDTYYIGPEDLPQLSPGA